MLLLCGLASAWAVASAHAAESPPVTIAVLPQPVTNGHTLMFEIDTSRAEFPVVGIQARFGGERIPVFRHPLEYPGIYVGWIGIPYRSSALVEQLSIEWTDRNGYHRIDTDFQISIGTFRSETLKVSARKVQPRPADLARIRSEKTDVRRVYAQGHPLPLWRGVFQKPLESRITSPFGNRRLFNGKLRSYHSGVDFRASVGTPVRAANAGIVRMARELFFSGNHVIIDHGGGIFTSYSHLDEFRVQPGRHVGRGDPIGLSGATGRVNGPHLHWSAKVHNVYVSPLDLMEAVNRLYSDRR